jgi:hypothetical protein
MVRHFRILISLCGVTLALTASAQPTSKLPPAELLPLIPTGTEYLAHAVGDLNGDSRQDYVLVVEKQTPDELQRLLLVIIRQPDGSLVSRKDNGRIVLCGKCGGIFGDPFVGVTASRKTFTVHHYGGSAWRWGSEYQFNYSSRDDTWQLVRVKNFSFHALDPEKEEVET